MLVLIIGMQGFKFLHAIHVQSREENVRIPFYKTASYPIEWSIELSRSNVPPFNAIEMSRNILLPFARNFILKKYVLKEAIIW